MPKIGTTACAVSRVQQHTGLRVPETQITCVFATGFNSLAPILCCILKNSWSTTWSEGGYIYLDMSENTCGVADDATVPKVTLDMSEAEVLKAVAKQEEMFLRAVEKLTQS